MNRLFNPNEIRFVLDTGPISALQYSYPDIFPSLWKLLQDDVNDGIISSVMEVRRELENRQIPGDFIEKWIIRNSRIFTPPDIDEQNFVRQLMSETRGKMLVSQKTIKAGKPAADPWIIAKALHTQSTVVTLEKRTAPDHTTNPTQGKIPDVCDGLKIPCINWEEFMRKRGWRF